MADLVRVSILGTMPSGEEWSVTPAYKLDVPGSAGAYPTMLTIAEAVNAIAIPASLTALMSSSTAVTGARVEARTAAGVLEATATAQRGTPVTGAGPDPHPFQTSVVCSLRTNTSGGRFRGRLYWPGTGAGLSSSTLRLDSPAQSAAVTGFKTYLSAIGAVITASVGEVDLAVWSRANSALTLVSLLLVGDVLDTQRRRRDAVPETYVQASYP